MADGLRATWGANLRAARTAAGWSLGDLARAAGGRTDPSNLSKIERGLVGVSDDMKTRLAAALGVPVGELFRSQTGRRSRRDSFRPGMTGKLPGRKDKGDRQGGTTWTTSEAPHIWALCPHI